MAPHSASTSPRNAAVSRVLGRVLVLNLLVAVVKLAFGYATHTVSIVSDGYHSLADSSANIVALVAMRFARKPPDPDHPYGHRKFETMASGPIVAMMALMILALGREAAVRVQAGTPPSVSRASFLLMGGTLVINLFVVWYEQRAARRHASELLLADASHTKSDVLTSLTVMAALVGVERGWVWLDPAAAVVVAGFIAYAGYGVLRETAGILSDRIVIAEDDLRRVVLSVPEVVGCEKIRTRGARDQVFLDLHIWMHPDTPLHLAHHTSHVVKDKLMARYPQITDAIIHIEPPPEEGGRRAAGGER
jgi:cation diffusion facilitator family transporter